MKVGIIGCGNMGSAIAHRLSLHHEVFLYGRHALQVEALAKEIKGVPCKSALDLVGQVEVVIVAVKPKDLAVIGSELAGSLASQKILISLLSGVTLHMLSKTFGTARVVRLMPNLAVRYGDGVSGITADDAIDAEEKKKLTQLFSSLGLIKWIAESLMDSLTALTGSGPAFALVMIEAMVDAAVSMGFPAEEGKTLVLQMLKGTISMLEHTNKHPGTIKWEIASPGGTTIAGLQALEAEAVRHGIAQAFLAAKARATEIGLAAK